MRMHTFLAAIVAASFFYSGCSTDSSMDSMDASSDPVEGLVEQFAPFTLTTDVSKLSENERQMLPLLIEAADIMNGLFLEQAFGPAELASQMDLTGSEAAYFKMNYGPWDRMNNNEPFIEGIGPKPAGANLYPQDMTREEFDAAISGSPEKEKEFKKLLGEINA